MKAVCGTNPFLITQTEAHLEPSQTSKMEIFTKIFNGLETTNIFAKKLHLKCLTEF